LDTGDNICLIGPAWILVIIFVQTFKIDIFVFIGNVKMCLMGETIHRMYQNRDYFGDGSVHDTWRPLAIQTI
jgi:hypothetical protein